MILWAKCDTSNLAENRNLCHPVAGCPLDPQTEISLIVLRKSSNFSKRNSEVIKYNEESLIEAVLLRVLWEALQMKNLTQKKINKMEKL